MVLTIRETISKMRGWRPVELVLQDPAYTEEDKRVLRDERATVVDSPRAFLEVDDNTLVFAIAPTIPVKQVVADIARPLGMFYYDDKSVWVKYPNQPESHPRLCEDPWSPRCETMVRRHYMGHAIPYPDYTREVIFYSRKPEYPADPGQVQEQDESGEKDMEQNYS
ncbi:hypothetical protein UCREL1_1684 [Eutypa lata UCREL1]|uniref:SRR1-like domain-containing protein n=1 Tax=Eutypa lata (strain UCR-EL1) TaxID=1287681 RepID=M7TMY7_EUTLA|nr:hypothetical protein UCREL1_1684 [Eutypa lata UCREL1]